MCSAMVTTPGGDAVRGAILLKISDEVSHAAAAIFKVRRADALRTPVAQGVSGHAEVFGGLIGRQSRVRYR